jgi:hypothetical protein
MGERQSGGMAMASRQFGKNKFSGPLACLLVLPIVAPLIAKPHKCNITGRARPRHHPSPMRTMPRRRDGV